MKNNSSILAKKIVLEAQAGDEQINALVEQAIDAAISTIGFDTLGGNFEEAKKQYYNNLRKHIANQLGVDPLQVGKFITSDMHKKFAEALQKAYEALQSTPDKENPQFTDPQFLTES